jgi:hypothetical protein
LRLRPIRLECYQLSVFIANFQVLRPERLNRFQLLLKILRLNFFVTNFPLHFIVPDLSPVERFRSSALFLAFDRHQLLLPFGLRD